MSSEKTKIQNDLYGRITSVLTGNTATQIYISQSIFIIALWEKKEWLNYFHLRFIKVNEYINKNKNLSNINVLREYNKQWISWTQHQIEEREQQK